MSQTLHTPNVTRTFNYGEYRNLVLAQAEKNMSTGEITPERIEATKLNAHRMTRIEKQVNIREDLDRLMKSVKATWDWIILAESWCGDGAQNIPVIAKIASANPNITVQIRLRDENPGLMDKYLTNGARSIPKLICFNSDTMKEIGTWGPRPKNISDLVREFKSKNPSVTHDEFVKHLHLWYARDRGQSIQEDFIQLVSQWKKLQ